MDPSCLSLSFSSTALPITTEYSTDISHSRPPPLNIFNNHVMVLLVEAINTDRDRYYDVRGEGWDYSLPHTHTHTHTAAFEFGVFYF